MDFIAVPIDSSLSCVTSLIVAMIALVFSKLTPALLACDATFINAVPMLSAPDALSKSMLVRMSFTLLAWSAANWNPFSVAVRISEASEELNSASFDSTRESLISEFVSAIDLPCLSQLSADSATLLVKLPSSCAKLL